MAARPDVSAGIAGRIWITALALLASVLANTTFAYERPTHVVLSQQAFQASMMDLIAFEYGMGAFGINNDGSITFQKYPDTTNVSWDLYALVQDGSWLEDDSTRSVNHFFNPVNNQPLSSVPFTVYTSPDWALATTGSITGGVLASSQSNSYFDARNYYWTALTATDPKVRSQNLGLMYQSLGQVIHHLEDMAQPQHARDEAHCDAKICALPTLWIQVGFYHPSAYERYMLYCTIVRVNGLPSGNCPALSGNYPAVFDQNNQSTYGLFNKPRDFWTESAQGNGGNPSYGIAEYTNAGFVGANTNFQGTPTALQPASSALPLPNGTGAQLNTVPVTGLLGGLFPLTAPMTFISTPVNDQYTGTPTTNPMTSAYSIFTGDLTGLHFGSVFTLNEFTYSSAASLLLPRAIGYSAGLLNFFFRGQLGISLPKEGVYGVIDQSQQYTAASDTDITGNEQGFHVIKVALTNASPDSEAMQNGTLAAVLRYRRNDNYVDTLQGEAGAPGNGNLSSARGPTDEYVVSGTVKDASGNVLSAGQVNLTTSPQEYEFDFPQALPLNSTDVYLQVVYKGDLGQEKQTAVVSSTIDLSEPTYINVFNSLDYISIGGQYVTRDQLDASPTLLALVQPQSCVNYNANPPQLVPSCFSDAQTIPVYLDAHNTGFNSQSLIVATQMPVDAYSRVAVLTNAFGSSANVSLNFASTCTAENFTVNGLNNEIAITSPPTATIQTTVQEGEYVSSLNSFRGILGWFNIFCVWDGDGSAQPTGDITKMTALSGGDIYPFPVAITFPQPGL